MEQSQNSIKEFDFRFPGLDPERDSARVRRLRDCLLELAGGFTEIRPGVLTDLLPGEGIGYIVALPDEHSLRTLSAALARLAEEWGCEAPRPEPASEGPRRDYAFFLVPRLANRTGLDYRRPLFSLGKWTKIRRALADRLSHGTPTVYGEWLPQRASRRPDKDASYIFIFKCPSQETVAYIEQFIKDEIFDGGKECDQEAIYLSARGEGTYVFDPSGR